jgi:hypothetical protein
MAKNQTPPDAAALAEAEKAAADAAALAAKPVSAGVVLFAFADHIGIGDIVRGDELHIQALVAGGNVDDHPDAIEAAQARGAKTIEV